MFMSKSKRKTQAVIIQRASKDGIAPGQVKQSGVAMLRIVGDFLYGDDASGRALLIYPASDVALAFIEDVPNG
jgi:hypothetical protein